MTEPLTQLAQLVSRLPERYQPIYGHPELSGQPSRPSLDRWEEIRRLHSALAAKLGRPVRVLDLGCSQGFFSLQLAAAGASVVGVDYNEANIAVCKALAAEHLALQASFAVRRVEEVLAELQPGQYDLLLGLSVFHHLVHEHGYPTVTDWLHACAPKVVCGLFELALASEPVYWARAQPERPQDLLAGFDFVHLLSHHDTHLSQIRRPLFFASSKAWYLDGHLEPFDVCQATSHHLAANTFQQSRKYFFNERHIAKQFSLDTSPHLIEANRREVQAEAEFLRTHPSLIHAPALVSQGENEIETWLVRERIPGEILSNLLEDDRDLDTNRILREVLDQLCSLESQGLYHNDLRVWNILITPERRAQLIDFGSITTLKQDVVWPHDPFLAFWLLVREWVTRHVESPLPQRQPFLSPYNLPEPYRAWAHRVWAHPPEHWTFHLLRELFDTPPTGILPPPDPRSVGLWMQAMETYLDTLNRSSREMHAALSSRTPQGSPLDDARREASLLTSRGEALEASNQTEAAIECYLKAMETAPDFPLSFLRLSELLQKSGDLEGARRCLEAGLDQSPKDNLLWEALIRQGMDLEGNLDQAAKDAWDALGQLPLGGAGRWHHVAAQGLRARGLHREATTVLNRGLHAFPGSPALLQLSRQAVNPCRN